MKKLLCLLLAVVMVLSLAACNKPADNTNPTQGNNPTEGTKPTEPSAPATYTYNGAASTFPTVWNPHTYQTATDSDILGYISDGFYTFDYNESGDGFAIVPAMTTEDHPIDITADYIGKFDIAEGDANRVYKIVLRSDLKWQDGSAITAHDFVESAKLLLNPAAANYRADTLYSGNMVIHNAMLYSKAGSFVAKQDNNMSPVRWTVADFTKDADGVYLTPQGQKVYIGTNIALDWLGGYTLEFYVNYYGGAYFGMDHWAELMAKEEVFETDADGKKVSGGVALTDETLAWLVDVITANPAWGESADNAADYLAYDYTYGEMSWDEVGIFALSDSELCIAIDKPLEGFYLKYALTSSWLVHVDTYKACESVDANGIYTNTYCTTAENTMSYGPYKLTYFELDKQYKLTKNDQYYGLSEDTYQTTDIVVDFIPEATTRLEAFLQGKLDSYGLTKEDMEKYQLSDYTYYSTGDSTFAMVFNPDFEALKTKQEQAGENINKTILSLVEFRQAMSFAMDRAKFCLATSPLNAPAFGLYSSLIISDPDAGTPYRTTQVAKETLAKFWGVADDYGDGKLYADIDEAIESITGYNLAGAKLLFDAAYDKAIAEGLMDADDKVLIMVGTPNNTSSFYNAGYEFIVNNYKEAVKGTKLEGKLEFARDDTLGNGFSDALKNNQVDMLFGVGWTGSALDPYGLMEAYVKPSYQYDDSTDFTAINCVIAIDGVEYSTSVWNWYCIMNGQSVEIKSVDGSKTITYSCGTADGDPATRLAILGALEEAVLLNYNFIPLMDDAGANLKGMQINYYTEDYIFGMGFGGVKYYTYEYSDAEWDAFVAEQGGTLVYN